jgi:hypothetical protein
MVGNYGTRGKQVMNTPKDNGKQTTTKMSLRVGIIQNGKLVEERWFRKATAVTIGTSQKNTFVVEEAKIPERFPLFKPVGSGFSMQIAEGMPGHIVHQGRRMPLTQADRFGTKVGSFEVKLGTSPFMSNSGLRRAVYELPLDEHTRGKVQCGDLTILFQFATPPPAPAQAVLPKWMKGSWRQGVDWAYASIITLSFVAHSLGVYWLKQIGPLQKVQQAAIIQPCFRGTCKQQELIIIPKTTPAPKTKEQKRKEKAEKSKKETDAQRKKNRQRRRARARKRMAKSQSNKRSYRDIGILKFLAHKGKQSGTVKDLIKNEQFDTMNAHLKKLNGVASNKQDGNLLQGTRKEIDGGNSPLKLDGTPVDLKPSKGPLIKQTKRKEAKIAHKIFMTTELPDVSNTTLDAKSVKSLIERHYGRIKYCYERALKSNNRLSGKISFEVTLNKQGKITNIRIVEDQLRSRKVSRCIIRRLRSIRFPKPKADDSSIELPFVFIRS